MHASIMLKLAVWILPVIAMFTLIGEAQARRRGPSPQQIKAAQEKQRAEQEAAQKYQAALDAKRREVFDRYDLNKNGKIDGTEKPMYDKYLREVKLGKQPDPLLAIPYPKVETKSTSKPSTGAPKKAK